MDNIIVNENDRSHEAIQGSQDSQDSRDALGELPHGRPPQTEFDTGLDYHDWGRSLSAAAR